MQNIFRFSSKIFLSFPFLSFSFLFFSFCFPFCFSFLSAFLSAFLFSLLLRLSSRLYYSGRIESIHPSIHHASNSSWSPAVYPGLSVSCRSPATPPLCCAPPPLHLPLLRPPASSLATPPPVLISLFHFHFPCPRRLISCRPF